MSELLCHLQNGPKESGCAVAPAACREEQASRYGQRLVEGVLPASHLPLGWEDLAKEMLDSRNLPYFHVQSSAGVF